MRCPLLQLFIRGRDPPLYEVRRPPSRAGARDAPSRRGPRRFRGSGEGPSRELKHAAHPSLLTTSCPEHGLRRRLEPVAKFDAWHWPPGCASMDDVPHEAGSRGSDLHNCRAPAALRQELQRLADAAKRAREGRSSTSSGSRAL